MLNFTVVSIVIVLYVGLLFTLSYLSEKYKPLSKPLLNSALIYSLSLAVYCTAWTYYGSVEMASSRGLLYLTIYLGPTFCAILWWVILRKLVRIKNRFRITSIVDFVSTRYGKSVSLGLIGSIIVFLGTIPYIALQLKAIIKTFNIVSYGDISSQVGSNTSLGWVIVILTSLCTIFFGLRKREPSERHPGIVLFLAIECLIKLVALLAVGIFTCYFLFDGFAEIIYRMPEVVSSDYSFMGNSGGTSPITFISYFLLGAWGILFLPRQFHVAVIENKSEEDIKVAAWVFPLYLFLINLFILPISIAGLLLGKSINLADTFVLLLPYDSGHNFLTILSFIGGFSAATGMIMISSLAVSIILSNHVFLPIISNSKSLLFLRAYLLKIRWLIVVLVISTAYLYTTGIGDNYALISMGMISFVAAAQFAPAILGGLFWLKGNTKGAHVGLLLGLLTWLHTLFVPAFATGGFIDGQLITNGPFGIEFLRPYQLFGLDGLDKVSHSLFWTMLFNFGGYISVSLLTRPTTMDKKIANEFVNAGQESIDLSSSGSEKDILLAEKIDKIEQAYRSFFGAAEAKEKVKEVIDSLQMKQRKFISIGELLLLRDRAEIILAGTIGSAMAHSCLMNSEVFTEEEDKELSRYFEGTLSELKISPMQLLSKLDFYKERQSLLEDQTKGLENLVTLRTEALKEKNIELNESLIQIKNIQEKMVAQEKLASLGALSAGIAHEIKNPLNFIINGAKIISSVESDIRKFHQLSMDEQRQHEKDLDTNLNFLDTATKMIIEHGSKADNIIQTMLQHSRSDTLTFSETNLPELLKRNYNLAYHGMKTKFPVNINPILNLEDVGMVQANEQSLGRAFFNIIDNAFYALYEKSNNEPQFKPQLEISCRKIDNKIHISIKDNGPGIPKAKLKDIFNPFVTSKPSGQGTGLGLSITNDIIAHHNGSIEIDSLLGEYTEFLIIIPALP